MRICLFKVSEGMWGCLLLVSEEMWECLFSCLNGRKNFSLSFLKESMTFSLGCPAWCLVVVWWDSCSPPPRTAPGSHSANKHLNRFPPRYSQVKVTQRCPGSKNLYAMSLTALKQSSRCPKKKFFFIIIKITRRNNLWTVSDSAQTISRLCCTALKQSPGCIGQRWNNLRAASDSAETISERSLTALKQSPDCTVLDSSKNNSRAISKNVETSLKIS